MSADFGSGTRYITVSNSLYGITGSAPTISASASAIFEDDEVPGGTGQEEYIVSGTVSYCAAGSNSNTNGSDMVVIDLLEDGTRRPGWGNGSGVALFNTCSGARSARALIRAMPWSQLWTLPARTRRISHWSAPAAATS